MKNKFFVPIFLFLFFCIFTIISPAFADDHGGNNSGGVITSCNKATAFQLLCGSPAGSDGGGASWHVYKTSSYAGPTFIENYKPLDHGTINVEHIKADCPASQFTTYTSYGWEGLNSRKGLHIGPANFGSGVIGGALYNNYNAVSDINTLKTMLQNGYDDIKITHDLAVQLHGGGFDGNTGYFCNPDLLNGQQTLTLKAIDNNGNSLSSIMPDKSVTVQKGQSATITASTTSKYLKIKWGTSINSSTWWDDTELTYYEPNLTINKVIYAIYKPNEITTTECPAASASQEVRMSVQNETTNTGWQTNVFAKPNDNILFCSSYNPSTPQSLAYDAIDADRTCNTSVNTFYHAFTKWNNAYGVQFAKGQRVNNATFSNSYLYSYGDFGIGTTLIQEHTNEYQTTFDDVSYTIDERATINLNNIGNVPISGGTEQGCKHDCTSCCTGCCDEEGKNCTCNCTCGCSYYDIPYISTNQKNSNSAQVRVPYNFINTTDIAASENTIVYAGESQKINFSITTAPKYNTKTKGNYATIVHGSVRKIKVEYQENGVYHTAYSNLYHEDLNTDKTKLYDGSTINRDISIVIPDLPAGSKIKVYSMVFPKDSGNDDNWNYGTATPVKSLC